MELSSVNKVSWYIYLQVKMRFSLPSVECRSEPSVEEDNLSSVELDGFVFHLALAASIVQILLTTSEDISSGNFYIHVVCHRVIIIITQTTSNI